MKQFSKLLREVLPCLILLGTTLARKDPLNPTQSGCSALHKFLCKEELVRTQTGLLGRVGGRELSGPHLPPHFTEVGFLFCGSQVVKGLAQVGFNNVNHRTVELRHSGV